MDYNTLDDKDLINAIVLGDAEESDVLEFKSHFGHPNPSSFKVTENNKTVYRVSKDTYFLDESSLQKYFEFQSIRVIVSFLNSNGGILVIGVSDKINQSGTRDIYGLINKREEEVEDDKFVIDLSTAIERKISKSICTKYVSIACVKRNTKSVCVVRVKKYLGHKKQLFIEKYATANKRAYNSLFIRAGNKTTELTDSEEIFEHGLETALGSEYRNSPTISETETSSLPFTKYGWTEKYKLLAVRKHDYEGVMLLLAGKGIALYEDPFQATFDREYNEVLSYVGNYIHVSEIPNASSHVGSNARFIDKVHLSPDDDYVENEHIVDIDFSLIVDLRFCPKRTVRDYWDHVEGLFKIITNDKQYFAFDLPLEFWMRHHSDKESSDFSPHDDIMMKTYMPTIRNMASEGYSARYKAVEFENDLFLTPIFCSNQFTMDGKLSPFFGKLL